MSLFWHLNPLLPNSLVEGFHVVRFLVAVPVCAMFSGTYAILSFIWLLLMDMGSTRGVLPGRSYCRFGVKDANNNGPICVRVWRPRLLYLPKAAPWHFAGDGMQTGDGDG